MDIHFGMRGGLAIVVAIFECVCFMRMRFIFCIVICFFSRFRMDELCDVCDESVQVDLSVNDRGLSDAR